MDRDAELDVIRRTYAKQVMAASGVYNRRIETAFASVKREDFLRRGPWQVVRWGRCGRRERDERQDHPQTVRTELDRSIIVLSKSPRPASASRLCRKRSASVNDAE